MADLTVEQIVRMYQRCLAGYLPNTRLFYDKGDPEHYWRFPGSMRSPDGDFCHAIDGYIEASGYTLEEAERNRHGNMIEVMRYDPDLQVDKGL